MVQYSRSSTMDGWLWCISLLLAISLSAALTVHDLYPHGQDLDTFLPVGDEVSSAVIRLHVPIVFYGEKYDSIYVNSNGLLSFQTEIPTFFNIPFPLDYPVIAPFYTNVDTRGSGYVSYRETQTDDVLTKISHLIRQNYRASSDFQATSVFLTTWIDVGYHDQGSDKVNTFQVAIASDGNETFVEFLYPENGIQWIQGKGSESGLPDARAQVGLVAHDSRMFTLPGSGTDRIIGIERSSNINAPGQWLFRVGRLQPDETVSRPDGVLIYEVKEIRTCVEGASQCHSQAKCVDYDTGFCCVCKKGYYGNGKTCLKSDIPLRVNGKINGVINGEKLFNLDLQSYVSMTDGRAYTAISKLPESIGYSLQSLNIIGEIIAWLFAIPISDAKNGYQITGGVFNHTAIINFTNSGEQVTIWHRYSGLDVFDQLRLEAEIHGYIPVLPPEERVIVPEYVEEYTVTARGMIQSQSTNHIKLPDGSQVPYAISQSYTFNPCEYADTLNISSFKVKVMKNFIGYESREKIIRYGMSSKVTPMTEEDPCLVGSTTCVDNSYCLVEGDTFRCVCHPGYQQIYDGKNILCIDINECSTGAHYCNINARCQNEEGSFSCICTQGYVGDGRVCELEEGCGNHCDPNAECVETSDGHLTCQCISGFVGTGEICERIVVRGCNETNYCSPHATCSPSYQGYYECLCLPGFAGDGRTCVKEGEPEPTPDPPAPPAPPAPTISAEHESSERVQQECSSGYCRCPPDFEIDPNTDYCVKKTDNDLEDHTLYARPVPQCLDHKTCFCPPGYNYKRSPQSCVPIPGSTHDTMGPTGKKLSCNMVNNCHPYAQCIFVPSGGNYECKCNAGYEGDGYECSQQDVSCREVDICDENAVCVEDEAQKHFCVCITGYQGDGLLCNRIADCASSDDCGPLSDCLFSDLSQRYECICHEGYAKDSSNICMPLSGNCGGGTCLENAQCLYDSDYQTYYCQCNTGYIGDGITECVVQPEGCNVDNNCGLNAACEYNVAISAYECVCMAGFYGDGFSCTSDRTCHVDPYICDRHATCVRDGDYSHTCRCNDGFTGNGTFCKLTPRHDGNFLLVSQGMAILRIPFANRPDQIARPIQFQHYQMAIANDIDCYEGRVYWSDIAANVIKSSGYDGRSPADFIVDDIGSPEGVSIDWVARNIFWVDSKKDTVEVANLETKLRKVLFSDGFVNPRGIAVHPHRGKIFWSDWNRDAPKIEWANMDGTQREIFLDGDHVKLPNSLAIDWQTDNLCFADAGTKNIECVNIDSRNIQTVVANCSYPFGLAITSHNLYWTDWISNKIESVDKATFTIQKPIEVSFGGLGNKMYGMTAVADTCPSMSSVCQFNNGNCPAGYLCLLNGSGSRSCVCAASDLCNDV